MLLTKCAWLSQLSELNLYGIVAIVQARGTVKDVVHVWELGGGLKLKDMLMVPITPGNISNVAICITIDLSEPGSALASLEKWLELVRVQYASLIKEYVVASNCNSYFSKFLTRAHLAVQVRVQQ